MTTKATSASASMATGDKPAASFWSLALGSIGVVYGDIGTSPLYAFREATVAAVGEGGEVTQTAVLGVLSLIVWALILVVTIKYVFILLYADNNGEGGTMALMALTQRVLGKSAVLPLALGLLGAGLFYGDAMITPAISVLSAVEGLKIVTPVFEPYVVPLTVVILVGLFAVQSRGTASVARYFGPITAAWFVAIAIAGLVHIADNPGVLAALNPLHAVTFLASNGMIGLVTLGAVFLAVTGAEALYADLGHFGRRPIQAAWLSLVLPALVINYFGQGALVLANPQALANPFFLLVPGWALLPMVMLATAATVIASQAVITGAFSLSSQAVQLGLLPRLAIRHTSAAQAGQIYMPRVNTILFVGVLLLVVMFASSSALASAYGVAVAGTMVVTAIMAFLVIWRAWRWSPWIAGALMGPLLLLDLTFLSANLLKVFHGGWVPLLIGTLVMAIMLTWRRGARLLMQKTRRLETPLKDLAIKLDRKPPTRIAGTAVFLTSDPESAPTALLHSLKHYKVLHERNVILTVATEDIPRVAPDERIRIEPVSKSFTRVLLRFGFMESPDVQRALTLARKHGLTLEPMSTSYFLSRRTLVQDPRSKLPAWQDGLFMLLARNADDASNYFRLPTNRVVEIGMQIAV